jgi:hypothetical protein
VQSDLLDQRHHLRLGTAHEDLAAPDAQAAGQHGQIEHHRRVGKGKLAQVDHHVRLCPKRAHHGASPASLRGPVLVSAAAQGRGVFIEVDDGQNLHKLVYWPQGGTIKDSLN